MVQLEKMTISDQCRQENWGEAELLVCVQAWRSRSVSCSLVCFQGVRDKPLSVKGDGGTAQTTQIISWWDEAAVHKQKRRRLSKMHNAAPKNFSGRVVLFPSLNQLKAVLLGDLRMLKAVGLYHHCFPDFRWSRRLHGSLRLLLVGVGRDINDHLIPTPKRIREMTVRV